MNIKRNFVYRYFLVNRTENVCDVAGGKKANPLMNLIIDPLRKYSNFIQRCPYPAGNISVVDCPINSIDKLPVFFPAGSYRVDVRLFNEHNVTIFVYIAFITIKAKGTDPLLVG